MLQPVTFSVLRRNQYKPTDCPELSTLTGRSMHAHRTSRSHAIKDTEATFELVLAYCYLKENSSHPTTTMSNPKSTWQGEPKTACFIFPEASGHINASLALTSHLTSQSNWTVHYLSAAVMKEAILDAGASFTDERTAAPDLCRGGLGYFAAYERLRQEQTEEGSRRTRIAASPVPGGKHTCTALHARNATFDTDMHTEHGFPVKGP